MHNLDKTQINTATKVIGARQRPDRFLSAQRKLKVYRQRFSTEHFMCKKPMISLLN